MKKIIFLFAAVVALTSCSITKRHYAPGYHVEWKGIRSHVELPADPIAEEPNKSEMKFENQVSSQENTNPISQGSTIQIQGESPNVLMSDFAISDEGEGQQSETNQIAPETYGIENKANTAFPQESSEAPVMEYPTSGNYNMLALIGFILSLFSVTALVGLILSIIGLKQIKAGDGEGKGLAIAGIVIGAFWILFYLAYIVLLFVVNIGYY